MIPLTFAQRQEQRTTIIDMFDDAIAALNEISEELKNCDCYAAGYSVDDCVNALEGSKQTFINEWMTKEEDEEEPEEENINEETEEA